MKIAIIGAGNVGGALAARWHQAGHAVVVGSRDATSPTVHKTLTIEPGIATTGIAGPIRPADVVLIATPPQIILALIDVMGDLSGKVIVDATNAVRQKPDPYPTVYHALQARTAGKIVKCFNSTGFENMQNPLYDGSGIDMFMAGDDDEAKTTAATLAKDAGFGACWDFGKSDNKVSVIGAVRAGRDQPGHHAGAWAGYRFPGRKAVGALISVRYL